MACGGILKDCSFNFRVAPNTVSNFLPDVFQAIVDAYKEDMIPAPNTPDEWLQISEQFATRWNFPHCLGAIDGKHVRIKQPAHSGSVYFNYKKFYSFILMALVDANYRFLWVDVGGTGSMSDAQIYNGSELKQAIEDGSIGLPNPQPLPGTPPERLTPYYFIGDDAFGLSTFMMKPYSRRGLSDPELIFNYRLSRARRVVENAFGIMAMRWQILLCTIQIKPERAQLMVQCIVCLHNLCRTRYPALAPGVLDREDEHGNVIPGEWRNQQELEPVARGSVRALNPTTAAKNLRQSLTDYVNSPEGSVPWQNDKI